MVDLDKTLIDVGYQITDERIHGEISRVQSLGWQIGLHSDTPLETLENWNADFGLNGPIIAERGAIVKIDDDRKIVTHESEQFFSQLRGSLTERMTQQRIPFYQGGSVQLLRTGSRLPNRIDPRLILVNAYRRCSLGIYSRRVGPEGEMTIDNEGLLVMVSAIREMMGNPPFDIAEDINPDYGVYIVSPQAVNKRNGALALMKELGLSEIGMIGDSTTDILGNDIAVHYAVGNARDEFKAIAKHTARGNYTTGVVDILQRIVE